MASIALCTGLQTQVGVLSPNPALDLETLDLETKSLQTQPLSNAPGRTAIRPYLRARTR